MRNAHWSKLRPLLAPYLERTAPAADLRAEVTRIVREVTGRVVPVGPLREVPVYGFANGAGSLDLTGDVVPDNEAALDRTTLDNAAHFNALLTEARTNLERLREEERAILTAQAAELPDLQAVVDRLRYWGDLLDRCDNDDTRRAFLQARVSQVTVQADRSVRLALVMTNEEVWQPRLELVITIAATAG